MPPFVHESGLCESLHVGDGTRVWAFAHILPGAVVGADCNICDGVFIENQVVLGDRVTVKCGVQLWDGVTVEDDVFIGPNATFSNDLFPRSRERPAEYAKTRIGAHASIGANATILPGITIGQYAMVGAGAVVTRSVPPYAVVYGNPARIMDYVGAHHEVGETNPVPKPHDPLSHTAVRGVQLHRLPLVEDLRGNLSVGEFERTVPFKPLRYFLVYDVPTEKVRGQHAHRECEQFLICVKGRCSVVADDGKVREEFVLDQPNLGLYLPPMVWGIQYKYTPDTVLMVFASHYYDAADYIRDYDEFLKEVHATTS